LVNNAPRHTIGALSDPRTKVLLFLASFIRRRFHAVKPRASRSEHNDAKGGMHIVRVLSHFVLFLGQYWADVEMNT
jgi:hypothetical protein